MSDTPEPEPESEQPENPEPEVPLNRAARRSKATAQPGHVGPRHDPARSGRGPRPHTKRSL